MNWGLNSFLIFVAIGGLAGVGQYLAAAVSINSLDKGVMRLLIVFVAGSLTIPTTALLAKIFQGSPHDFYYFTWTIQVGLAMTFGQRIKEEQSGELFDRINL